MPIPPAVPPAISMLASVLSIASSIKKIMVGENKTKKDAIQSFKETATAQEIEALNNKSINNSISRLLVIPDDVLKAYLEQAQRCVSQHVEGIKNAKKKIDMTVAGSQATQCVCHVLGEIRLFNDNNLPEGDDFLQNLWASYRCSE